MADWMTPQGLTHVAMDSTGMYWKPVYLVNGRHLKQVPRRNSDVRECR